MHLQVNGIGIHCEVEGADGAPWVVFSNSLVTNLTMWDAQAAMLRQKFRVLRYDQRGHGGTEATAGRYDFDLLIADLAGLLDALGVARAHLVGLSMGGVTVLGLAARFPERVDSVVVCDTGAASSPESARAWEERIALAQAQGMDPLVEPTVTRWCPPEIVAAAPPHLDRLRQMIRTTPVNGFVGCAAALADHDMRPAAAALRVPATFVVGEKDGTTPAAMRRLHDSLPGSRYEVIPGAGHIANLDQPEHFDRVLGDCLRAGA
ncbi:alpha/beta fold hydrolase [Rhodoplanes roseus]|nr:alpha/beta fold hydrolase [Rhodoplanes roseus]